MRYVTIRVHPKDMHTVVRLVDQKFLTATTIQRVAFIETLAEDVAALSKLLGQKQVPHIIETNDEGYTEMAAFVNPQRAGYVKVTDNWVTARVRYNAEIGAIEIHTDDETGITGFYAAYLELSALWGGNNG
ncbi:MAG: hypothetical protein FOGNACKC_00852 [Anaerolineae bacterium]|nr:hypothetical protein [Anaerolineae bacterium]